MIRILALLEGAAVCAAVWGSLAGWALTDGFAHALMPALTVAACAAVSFYYNDLYDLSVARSLAAYAARLPQALAIMLVLWGGLQTVWPQVAVPVGSGLASLLAACAAMIALRCAVYAWMRGARRRRVLILGGGAMAQRLRTQIEAQPHRRLRLAGIVESSSDVTEMDALVDSLRPHLIAVALEDRRGRLPIASLVRARSLGIEVQDALELDERLSGKIAIETLRPGSLLFSSCLHTTPADRAAARALSMAASIAGLAVALPVMALIAGAIRLDSKGPVLFRQARVGLRGRRFRMLKFRTMHPVEREDSVWARDNDDRITRVGRVLRKFRLDELPQLFNILRGDMNLVGPRPHPEVNYALFTQHIPHYRLREAVRPGVTGWAQIRYAYANNLEEETEKMRYDLYYIKHTSFWFDLRILVDTVKVVLLGRESGASAITRTAARGDAARRPMRGGDTAA
ncbi:MAG: sugar transferase [Candidatus Polarisedimenticolia bacterium]